MMIICTHCDGKGSLFKDRAAADANERMKCIVCGGTGKVHDDADAFNDHEEARD